MMLSVSIDRTSRVSVGSDLVWWFVLIFAVIAVVFFGGVLLRLFGVVSRFLLERVGVYSVSKEYSLQRYVYQNSRSLLARVYNWVNWQLIALGVKRHGVTVTGYLLFWGFFSFALSLVVLKVINLSLVFFGLVFTLVYVGLLVVVRVLISDRMETREMEIMDAIDLITPVLDNGVKNAILLYRDNFAVGIRGDFQAFLVNLTDRGYSFEKAMIILADSLGLIFRDFAEKAIYFELVGEKDLLENFSDILETNRLRRQIRAENNRKFSELRITFGVSLLLVVLYFLFQILTDRFTRLFFLQYSVGKVLLLVIVGIVLGVYAYIGTIKSRMI